MRVPGLWASGPWSCAHSLCLCFRFSPQTRTGMASLLREGSGSACDVRLKLTKEVLTIQKQDVVCVGGSSHGAHVSAPWRRAPRGCVREAAEQDRGREYSSLSPRLLERPCWCISLEELSPHAWCDMGHTLVGSGDDGM